MTRKKLLCASLLLGGSLGHPAVAGERAAELRASPGQCVTMKQGQHCYQDIRLSWRAAEAGDFCLYLEGGDAPLHCWRQAGAGEFEHEFARRESRRYLLRRGDSGEVVAEALVAVKWVYQRRSNHGFGWRVF